MLESLTEKSHTFEELVDFGLYKFEIKDQPRSYLYDLIRTNKSFYTKNRDAFRDLLSSIISHPPIVNSFIDWLETIAPLYLKEDEKFWVIHIEDRLIEIEKKIDGLYDILSNKK